MLPPAVAIFLLLLGNCAADSSGGGLQLTGRDDNDVMRNNGGIAVLHAHLLWNASTRSGAVAEIEHASVPEATTWFHLRPTAPPPAKPDGLMHSMWRARTTPKPVGQLPQGVQQFPFDAACEFAAGCNPSRKNYSFIVEAWSDRNDLGGPGKPELLAQSLPLKFHFDDLRFASGLRFTNFTAREHAPGHVTISCLPNSETLYAMAEVITWFGYDLETNPPNGLPTFSIDERVADGSYSTRLVSPPSISVTLSSPGTYYIGMYGAFNGDEGGGNVPHLGVKTLAFFPSGPTGYSTFQPFAIVVPYENGTQVPTPKGFTGPIHVTAPIPGDWRLPMHRASATVFDGGDLYLPLVKGLTDPKVGPTNVELELPIGVSIRLPVEFANVSSVLSGGGAVAKGFHRVRITNTNHDDWGYLNADVKLKINVAPGLLQGNGPCTYSGGRVRAFTGAANQARSDNWQSWTLIVAPLVPVPALPKRLTTGFCWAGSAEFGTTPEEFGMWRKLGFNVIPAAGVSVAPFFPGSKVAPGVFSAANRTGPAWAGMRYGMITNGMEVFHWLSLSPAAAQAVNLSAYGVPEHEVAAERAQLVAAAYFKLKTKLMDVSYDGWFYKRNVAAVAALVKYSRPNFLSFDVETMPPFESWAKVAAHSPNFLARMKPGETRSARCLRIAQGWMGGVISAARAEMPTLQPAMYTAHAIYDSGFQLTSWPMLASLGFSTEPSFYDKMNSLDRLAASTRAERLAVGHSTSVIPWLSPGETVADGGAPPEDTDPGLALFNSLLQVLTSGATGFHMYTHDGFVDMSMWLAVRNAIALVTPHEDIIMDGTPAPADGTFSKVASAAVVSAMVSATGSMLIGSSTMPSGQATEFTVATPHAASGWLLCNLATKKSVPAGSGGSATWASATEKGSVLLFAGHTPCHT